MALACGDSLDIFVGVERAYLPGNGHDHGFPCHRTHMEGRCVEYRYRPYPPRLGRGHNALFRRDELRHEVARVE